MAANRTPEMQLRRSRRSPAKDAFLMFLAIVAFFYGIIIAFHLMVPRRTGSGAMQLSFLEQCREQCLSYGLIPTGHLANDAKAYLRSEKPRPITMPLQELLAENPHEPLPSQPHSLLLRTAPDFDLSDDRGQRYSLLESTKRSPVVLVFYYGYHCNHCVGQLFGLNEDLQRFVECGTRVIAISADPPEVTAKRFAEYGRFDFPVLADTDNRVAEAYGVFHPEINGKPEVKLHGTFVIDSDGKVLWCNTGNQPFLDNVTLLTVIAQNQQKELPRVATDR